MSEKDFHPPNTNAIARISVDRLFGRHTYVIPTAGADDKRTTNLMLLYGDNGSGKTTILKMLYSLLSPAQKGGFKTFLAQTPFVSFSVSLTDGTTVAAVRAGSELIRSFDLNIAYANGSTSSISLRAKNDNAIRLEADEEREYGEFLARIRELGIALYYLPDDRRLQRLHVPDEMGWDDEDLELRYVVASHDYAHRMRSERLSAARDPGGSH